MSGSSERSGSSSGGTNARKALLKALEQREKADAAFYAAVLGAREDGLTLEEIGQLLGVSRQAVHQYLRRKT